MKMIKKMWALWLIQIMYGPPDPEYAVQLYMHKSRTANLSPLQQREPENIASQPKPQIVSGTIVEPAQMLTGIQKINQQLEIDQLKTNSTEVMNRIARLQEELSKEQEELSKQKEEIQRLYELFNPIQELRALINGPFNTLSKDVKSMICYNSSLLALTNTVEGLKQDKAALANSLDRIKNNAQARLTQAKNDAKKTIDDIKQDVANFRDEIRGRLKKQEEELEQLKLDGAAIVKEKEGEMLKLRADAVSEWQKMNNKLSKVEKNSTDALKKRERKIQTEMEQRERKIKEDIYKIDNRIKAADKKLDENSAQWLQEWDKELDKIRTELSAVKKECEDKIKDAIEAVKKECADKIKNATEATEKQCADIKDAIEAVEKQCADKIKQWTDKMKKTLIVTGALITAIFVGKALIRR